jgi:predicted transcriptional regulator
LLAAAERRMGIADRLATLIFDQRNPLLVTHSVGACCTDQAVEASRPRGDVVTQCARMPDGRAPASG